MAEFSNRDEVKRWLDAIEPAERRREIAVALAARAALRFARFGQPRRSDAAKFIHDRCRAKPAARPLRSATIMETKRQRRAQRSRLASATAERLGLDGEHGDGRQAKPFCPSACQLSPHPILPLQPFDASELRLVVGDERQAEGERMGGDQQVIAADRSARPFEPGANFPVHGVGGDFERQDFERAEHRLELTRQPERTFLLSAEAQLRRGDDARADVRFPNAADVLDYRPLRIADKIGDDVRVEKIRHLKSTGLGGASSIAGKLSSMRSSPAKTLNSERGAAGSIISLSPSRRMIASAPGSSNSRGIRTAWFLPFLKSLTCRASVMPPLLAYATAYAKLVACVTRFSASRRRIDFLKIRNRARVME